MRGVLPTITNVLPYIFLANQRARNCTLHTATVVILGPSARTVAEAKRVSVGRSAPHYVGVANFAALVASQVSNIRKTSSESSVMLGNVLRLVLHIYYILDPTERGIIFNNDHTVDWGSGINTLW